MCGREARALANAALADVRATRSPRDPRVAAVAAYRDSLQSADAALAKRAAKKILDAAKRGGAPAREPRGSDDL